MPQGPRQAASLPMICRVSPKLPRGRGQAMRTGTVVTCGLPVNISAGLPAGIAAKPRSIRRPEPIREISRATVRCAQRVDDLLMKKHEFNPLPKNHNKKIHSSFE